MLICPTCRLLFEANRKGQKFCSKVCLGRYIGKQNKGKKYRRLLKEYHGNQTSFKKGIHSSPRTEIKNGQHLNRKTQFKKGNAPWNKDKEWSEEHKQRLRIIHKGLHRGENNGWWRGGVSSEYQKIRGSRELKRWREAVYKRDNYTCQSCKIRGKPLNADHIKPFALYPELRFDIDNGKTLCEDCHRQTETYGSKLSIKIRQGAMMTIDITESRGL